MPSLKRPSVLLSGYFNVPQVPGSIFLDIDRSIIIDSSRVGTMPEAGWSHENDDDFQQRHARVSQPLRQRGNIEEHVFLSPLDEESNTVG